MRHVIRWEESIEHWIEIEVDDDELIAWALKQQILLAADNKIQNPTRAELEHSVQNNPHLRSRIIQLYAQNNPSSHHTNSTARAHPREEKS